MTSVSMFRIYPLFYIFMRSFDSQKNPGVSLGLLHHDDSKSTRKADECPDCGNKVYYLEAAFLCPVCGYSVETVYS